MSLSKPEPVRPIEGHYNNCSDRNDCYVYILIGSVELSWCESKLAIVREGFVFARLFHLIACPRCVSIKLRKDPDPYEPSQSIQAARNAHECP